MVGYKAMIKDRLIPVWNLALLWCKCKTKWINLVYDIHIKKLKPSLKSETCKAICGHKTKDGIYLPFMATVSNDDCFKINSQEEYEFWSIVYTWVKWFGRYTLYMKDDIFNLSEESFKNKWNIDTKLYKFMLKHKDLL